MAALDLDLFYYVFGPYKARFPIYHISKFTTAWNMPLTWRTTEARQDGHTQVCPQDPVELQRHGRPGPQLPRQRSQEAGRMGAILTTLFEGEGEGANNNNIILTLEKSLHTNFLDIILDSLNGKSNFFRRNGDDWIRLLREGNLWLVRDKSGMQDCSGTRTPPSLPVKYHVCQPTVPRGRPAFLLRESSKTNYLSLALIRRRSPSSSRLQGFSRSRWT